MGAFHRHRGGENASRLTALSRAGAIFTAATGAPSRSPRPGEKVTLRRIIPAQTCGLPPRERENAPDEVNGYTRTFDDDHHR